jgi:hypothetical protein
VPKKKPAKSLPPKDLEGEEDEEDASVAGTPDPVKREAIRILQDFSTLGHSQRTAVNSPKEG